MSQNNTIIRFLLLVMMTFTFTGCACKWWPDWLPGYPCELPCFPVSKLPWNACCQNRADNFYSSAVNTENVTMAVLNFATKLEHEKFLILKDSRVYFDSTIRAVRLEFTTQSLLTMREGRELLVDVTEGILDWMNNDPELLMQMKLPFTANNLEIYINLESYWGLYGDTSTYLGWVVLQDGLAYYYAADIKDYHSDYWHKRVEPYYKSLEFVTISRQAEEDYIKNNPTKIKKLSDVRYDARTLQKSDGTTIDETTTTKATPPPNDLLHSNEEAPHEQLSPNEPPPGSIPYSHELTPVETPPPPPFETRKINPFPLPNGA